MFGLLLTLLILDGILLVVVVLLQAGKGGGLAAMGGGAGTDTFMGGRQAATVLTKATWSTGAVFLGLSVVLSILSSRQREPTPLLQEQFRQEAPAAPQPILPGAGDEPGAGEVVPGVPGGAGGGEEGGEPSGPGQ